MVERSLSMREAPGSIPGLSTHTALHVGGLYSSVGQSARLVSARSGVRTSLEAILFVPSSDSFKAQAFRVHVCCASGQPHQLRSATPFLFCVLLLCIQAGCFVLISPIEYVDMVAKITTLKSSESLWYYDKFQIF